MIPLLNNSETQIQGHFSYRNDDDNVLVFDDLDGRSFEICVENLERIINFSNPELPSEYYREKRVFGKR